jgi:tetratricopeptide (TPR) repeat protein
MNNVTKYLLRVNPLAFMRTARLEPLVDTAASPEDIDVILDRHQKAIRELPKGEANLHRRHQALAVIEAELTELLTKHGPNPRALVMHADLATQLRQWQQALHRWQKVADLSDEHRALAHLRVATVHRLLGNLHAASSALRDAETAGLDQKGRSYKRQKEALEKGLDAWVSTRLVQKSVDALSRGEEDRAVELLRTGMLVKGTDAQTVHFADSVFRQLVRLTNNETAIGGTAASTVGPEHRHEASSRGVVIAPIGRSGDQCISSSDAAGSLTRRGPAIVLTCGLGWSGSGAVTDFLREFTPVKLPFGTTELGCFELQHSAKSILAAAKEKRGDLRVALVAFFLNRVLGLTSDSHDAAARLKVEIQSLVRFFRGSQHELDVLQAASINAFNSIYRARDCPDRAQRTADALRTLFSHVIGMKCHGNDLVLLNNVIHAQSVNLIELLPNSRAVVVVRDPRDQFVSRLTDRASLDVDQFIHQAASNLKRCRKALEDPAVARCVDVIRFEDFVYSAELRCELIARLGLSDADRNGERKFFPEQSQQNVGIHRGHSRPGDIARIHEALAPHLITPTLCPAQLLKAHEPS